MPVSVQIPLLLKVLSFDRTITLTPTGQQREEISIGIIFHSRVGASARARDEAVRILRQPGIRCAGLRVRVVSLDLGADESIDVAMARERLAVYYVTPVRGSDLELIRDQARADHSITLTGMPALMSKGLAVGIGLRRVPEQQSSSTSDEDERPEIIINPSEARKQGADFTSQLLKLARIVGGQGHE